LNFPLAVPPTAPPVRIASLAPSNTEILAALGLQDRIVGVDDYSDYPHDLTNRLPRLGPDLRIDMDKLESLRPDLVVASLSVPGMERNVEELQKRNMPYMVLDPQSVDDIFENIRSLGMIAGVPERAANLNESLKKRIDQVKRRTSGKSKKKIYWEWWPRPLITPGRLNWLTEVSAIAGGENIFADRDASSVTVSPEEVIQKQPDVIIAVWCGIHKDKVDPRKIASREGWHDIPAVKNGHIWVLEEGMYCRPSPRLIDGLEELAERIHPPRTP
jgi:iron complex transport system substrate-binding protein